MAAGKSFFGNAGRERHIFPMTPIGNEPPGERLGRWPLRSPDCIATVRTHCAGLGPGEIMCEKVTAPFRMRFPSETKATGLISGHKIRCGSLKALSR
ncbi:TetR family transcriptional regulator [Anopheles sinensis]|uniref:TetR family transcriptional regulator n=1 Tax=Anopheles sinensis TaxID=74873 RepID=A0A084W6F7_ANOSI|nr:TetR family transcriptional regulator [Anopheles sinensis]